MFIPCPTSIPEARVLEIPKYQLRAIAKFWWFVSLLFKSLISSPRALFAANVSKKKRHFFPIRTAHFSMLFWLVCCSAVLLPKKCPSKKYEDGYHASFQAVQISKILCSSIAVHTITLGLLCVCINLDMDIIEEMLFDVFFAEHKHRGRRHSLYIY